MITDGETIWRRQLDLLDLAASGPRPVGHVADNTVMPGDGIKSLPGR